MAIITKYSGTQYSGASRLLHWLVAALVLILVPVGLWMAGRAEANLWGALTDTLYAWHKAIGFTLLLLMVVRIVVKVRGGTPAYPSSLSRSQVIAAKSLHHLLNLLLILTPLLGWAGVTAFPALITLGGYHLPALPFVPQSETLAATLFEIHEVLALTLATLVLGHVAVALKHRFVNRDGIFQRMWPGR